MPLRLVTLFFIVLFLPASAKAGGWARAEDQVFIRTGAGFFFGQQPFEVAAGPSGTFRGSAAEFYGEFGLGANFEADLSLRWVSNTHDLDEGPSRTRRGLEDFELLFKWAAVNEGNALSLLAGTRIALYDRLDLERSLVGDPELGPGGADILLGLSFGHSFYPAPLWFNLDLIHRLRLASPSSGLLLRSELGVRPAPPLAFAAVVELQPAFGRDLDSPSNSPAPVPKAFGLGLKLLLSVAHGFGILGDFLWFPDVLNDGPGVRFGLGLSYETPAN
ncbi:MAG: hypothetical protein AAGF12_04450 [Myxococcota bacterium]